MELRFLGRGSAFNTAEGNTSAYFIERNELFLIDCGETVFSKIKELNLLKDISKIRVCITHLHPDHIGSLGTLIFYAWFMMNQCVDIIADDEDFRDSLKQFLSLCGVTEEMYNFVYTCDMDDFFDAFSCMGLCETTHAKTLKCFSISFKTSKGMVYYSGDTNSDVDIELYIRLSNKIDKLYIETTILDYPENPHLYIKDLERVIPPEMRKKVFCMHLSNIDTIVEALNSGFNVVTVEK